MADKMDCIWGPTLTGIGDAIRAKTGTSDKIDPNDMPAAIESIEGSGGAEGCATVTFMDGDAVLLSRPVYIGDDCPDPVAQGRIDAPTKDSTIDTVYTFNGWSGSLEGITEDTTVEAVYEESVREYTVRFYDGETLLHTEQVPYGGSSEYEYQKAELMFSGWSPAPTNITGDMDCYGEWIDKPNFATSSWETIAQISESGQAADVFNVGDERDIIASYADGTSETITLQIAGFNEVPGDCDGVSTVKTWLGMVLVPKHVLGVQRKMCASSSTAGGGFVAGTESGKCDLYNWLQDEFYNALPDDFSAVLKQQAVGAGLDKSTFTPYPVYALIAIPSAIQTHGQEYESTNFGVQKHLTLFQDESNRRKTKSDGTSVGFWLTNTSQSGSVYQSGYVAASGGLGKLNNNSPAAYVLPMFCI
jgi:hypothetical protein